jgi:protein ImuA
MSLEPQAERAPFRVKAPDEQPPAIRAARLDFLRRTIARVEDSVPCPPVTLGARGLDRMLGGGLRRGALHEIAPARPGDGAAACGFALALAARLAAKAPASRSAIIWIVEDFARLEGGAPYGPGLALHGVDPARLILVHTANARDSLWTMEEALKCRAAAAVIGEIWHLEKIYDLTAARRLALAAQAGGAAALMLAAGLAGAAARLSSCARTRFEVSAQRQIYGRGGPLPGLPLPGPAGWSVRILKMRGGAQSRAPAALFWDHEEACFRDAFPLRLSADARDRPDHAAEARAGPRQTA